MIFLFTYIFLNSVISPAAAEIINKFKIDGNERIPNQTIIMFSGINIGDDISTENLNEILKRIYESNFFEDARSYSGPRPTLPRQGVGLSFR